MKATELMIGDWVRIYYVNKLGRKVDKVFQVGQIRDGYGELCVWAIPTEATRGNMGTLEPRYGESYISPIPLTPEILEMNGFDKRYAIGHLEWVLFNERFSISIEEWLEEPSEHDYVLKYERADILEPFTQLTFSYVHELQHALRLCGIEKEIEL